MKKLPQLAKKITCLRPSFETSIGAIVYNENRGDRRYLLLRYPQGHWGFVKGHIEKGESHKDTLLRELKEETGITSIVRVRSIPQNSYSYSYTAKDTEVEKRIHKNKGIFVFKNVVYYAVETDTLNVRLSDEHNDYLWLPYSTAMERITFKNSQNILRSFHTSSKKKVIKKRSQNT